MQRRTRSAGRVRGLATALASLIVSVACAYEFEAPPTMVIANQSRVAIQSVQSRPCGFGSFEVIPGTEIAVKGWVEINVPRSCVDLKAVDVRGRVAGEQRGLRMVPGARWTIR